MNATPEHVHHHHGDAPRQSGWLPMGLLVLAVLLLAAYQTFGLVRAHATLGRVLIAQQPTVVRARKMRATLQTIATHTAELAANGDQAARDVLDFMHREGVTVALPKQK